MRSNNLSVNQWIGVLLLISIPVVNIVLIFVWAFAGGQYPNKTLQNFSRALLKLSTIIIVICLGIVVAMGGKLASLSSSRFFEETYYTPLQNPVTESSNIESKITFNNVVYQTVYGMTTASGETTNRDQKSHSYSVIVTFFDGNKNIVGTAFGIVSNIGPGQTKTFEAVAQSSLENAKSYKVDVDSVIY